MDCNNFFESINMTDPKDLQKLWNRVNDCERAAAAARDIANNSSDPAEQQEYSEMADALEKLAKDVHLDTKDIPSKQNSQKNSSSEEQGEKNTKNAEENSEESGKNSNKNNSTGSQNNGSESEGEEESSKGTEGENNSNKNGSEGDSENKTQTNSKQNQSSNPKNSDDAEGDSQTSEGSESDSEGSQNNSSDNDTQKSNGQQNNSSNGSQNSDPNSQQNGNGANQSQSTSNSNQSGNQGQNSQENQENDPFGAPHQFPTSSEKAPEPTLDDYINSIKKLTGEAKRGAIDGLKDLLNAKSGNTLLESSLSNMSDDEYNDFIKSQWDKISQKSKISVTDMTDNINQIQTKRNDVFAKNALQDEILKNSAQDGVKGSEIEAQNYSGIQPISKLRASLLDALSTETVQVRQLNRTWKEINNDYPPDVRVKADSRLKHDVIAKPRVEVYYDQSRSWVGNVRANDVAKQVIATVRQCADEGYITFDGPLYFSDADYDGFATTLGDSRLNHFTYSWKAIITNIVQNDTANVIIITDHDMNDQATKYSTIFIEGKVWWVWKGASNAPNLPKKLIGLSGSEEFSF